MPNPKLAAYKVIGVTAHRTEEIMHKGAPTEQWMVRWGKRRRVAAVIRFYPSRKGWRVLDIRNAIEIEFKGKGRFWKGQGHSTRYYPNEDAAVMAAMHYIAAQPVML